MQARPLRYAGLALVLAPLWGVVAAADLDECVVEPSITVDVSSSEVGVLAEILVDTASRVTRGQVIASLQTDVEEAVLELSQARARLNAEISVQQEQGRFLSRRRKRLDGLDVSHSISQEALDEVRTEETLARLRVEQLREERELARLQSIRDRRALARREVRSPIDGVVAQRLKDAGEYIDGDTIVQLVKLDPLHVRIVAPLSLHGQVGVGMQAMVKPELESATARPATVTHIDPVADVATATFGIRLELPNPGGKLPGGLRCSAKLDTGQSIAAAEPSATERGAPSNSQTPAATTALPASGAPTEPGTLQTTAKGRRVDGNRPPGSEGPALASRAALSTSPTFMHSVSDADSVGPRARAVLAALPRPQPQIDPNPVVPPGCAVLGPVPVMAVDRLLSELARLRLRHEPIYPNSGDKAQFLVLSETATPDLTRAIASLRAEGRLKDVARLRRGAWAGRYSFGVFRGLRTALARVRGVSKLGISSAVHQRNGRPPSIWIRLSSGESGDATRTALEGLLEQEVGLELRPTACKR